MVLVGRDVGVPARRPWRSAGFWLHRFRCAGSLLALCLAGFWVWLARMWYRTKVAGWWALLATLIVFGVSNVVTFSHLDLREPYKRMGYPEGQME
jgi:hypothetical protein